MVEPVGVSVRVSRGGSALGGAAVASGTTALKDLKERLNKLLTGFIEAEELHDGTTRADKDDEEEDDDDDGDLNNGSGVEHKKRKLL